MARNILRAAIGLLLGYVAGALAGAMLVQLFSTNTHDKSLEVAMTAAFVAGPAGAVIGVLIAWFTGGSRRGS